MSETTKEKYMTTSGALMFYGTLVLAGLLFGFLIFSSLVRLLFWPSLDAVLQIAIYVFLMWGTMKWMEYVLHKYSK